MSKNLTRHPTEYDPLIRPTSEKTLPKMMASRIREWLKSEDVFQTRLKEYIKFLEGHKKRIKDKYKNIDIENLIQELQKLSEKISVFEWYREDIMAGTLSPEKMTYILKRLADSKGEFIKRYDSFIKVASSYEICNELFNEFIGEITKEGSIKEKDAQIIQNYIILPIQRVLKYHLFLKEIIDERDKSGDNEIQCDAQKLLGIVTEKNKQVNDSVSGKKSEQKPEKKDTVTRPVPQQSDKAKKQLALLLAGSGLEDDKESSVQHDGDAEQKKIESLRERLNKNLRKISDQVEIKESTREKMIDEAFAHLSRALNKPGRYTIFGKIFGRSYKPVNNPLVELAKNVEQFYCSYSDKLGTIPRESSLLKAEDDIRNMKKAFDKMVWNTKKTPSLSDVEDAAAKLRLAIGQYRARLKDIPAADHAVTARVTSTVSAA